MTRQPFISNRIDGAHGSEVFHQLGVASILYIPIVFNEVCIGVVNVLFTKSVDLSEEEKETLIAFGKYVGAAYNKLYPLSYLHS